MLRESIYFLVYFYFVLSSRVGWHRTSVRGCTKAHSFGYKWSVRTGQLSLPVRSSRARSRARPSLYHLKNYLAWCLHQELPFFSCTSGTFISVPPDFCFELKVVYDPKNPPNFKQNQVVVLCFKSYAFSSEVKV